jgi:hypothetical protein
MPMDGPPGRVFWPDLTVCTTKGGLFHGAVVNPDFQSTEAMSGPITPDSIILCGIVSIPLMSDTSVLNHPWLRIMVPHKNLVSGLEFKRRNQQESKQHEEIKEDTGNSPS